MIGKTFDSNSAKAISIELENASSNSIRIGALIEICRALAPTILAFSKRVIFGGPIEILAVPDVF